ncbi:MAG TPA: hypothetical protein VNT75_32405 [Symbiobacteriaceae bacterium]|nr:hypothetical protein [Symbiobacteriaceae bacterium]
MESWQVRWYDTRGQELRREFPTFIDAWDFNESSLKGRGEVTLLTDRQLLSERDYRSEAAAARQLEGGPRRAAPKKK